MGLYELLTHVKFISAKPKAAAEIRSTKNAMHAEKKKQSQLQAKKGVALPRTRSVGETMVAVCWGSRCLIPETACHTESSLALALALLITARSHC